MQLELELDRKRTVILLLASSAEAAWEGGIARWFERCAAGGWQHGRPTAVVAPTRGQLNAIKSRLLASGQSALGVEFLTPPYVRARLTEALDRSPVRSEHLRLLLSLAAEETLAGDELSDAERLAAIAVQRTPNHLLNLLERLESAGIGFDDVDLAVFRPLVRRFAKHRDEADFALISEADRAALGRARENAPVFRAVLLTGFHGGHWPLWHLLRAAAHACDSCTVVLQHPRDDAIDLDATWVGSWEELYGEPKIIDVADQSHVERTSLFLAGLDTREQAEAVVAAAHQFLADETCTRVGIIFPTAGALSRLVAATLARERVPHYDAMGQIAPGIFGRPIFQSWIELQRTPRLGALLRFLRALESGHPLFENVSREAIAHALQKALGDLAIDDLTMLVASARDRGGKGELVSAALDRIRFLPAHATFARFLDATRDAFECLGWHDAWREIEVHTAWTSEIVSPFSQTLYLRWLEEIATTDFRAIRDSAGAHPYARVQLLTPAQAEDQTWSHSILTSLNAGLWPASASGDFVSAPQIEALNESTRQLNRTATRRGRQGEGHVAVREGRALLLGSAQQRQLAEAQFASLVENTTHGVAFTASVIQEDAPERISNPSEFLNNAYHGAHGRSLSHRQMRALRAATRAWLDRASLGREHDVVAPPSVRQTRVAYDARRVSAPSDEYDFALRAPPRDTAPLSVSEVEEMLKAPAIVWMRRYLGVEGEEDAAYAWDATIGKWTHDWLATVNDRSQGFAAFPPAREIEKRIRAAAERKRKEVEDRCRKAGRHLPDWWLSGWEGALCVAQTLGRVLSTATNWPWLATEWRLDAEPIDLSDDRRLLLRGRADLLLARTASAPASLQIPELWIIDFKTGNKDALNKGLSDDEQRLAKVRRKVLKGDALQLSLYAQAASQLGAETVRVSLISPNLATAEPQLALEDFAECIAAYRELARMQSSGVFGFKGPLRSAYSFTRPYPLATLPVDAEIVEERWEKTHPDLALESSYWR